MVWGLVVELNVDNVGSVKIVDLDDWVKGVVVVRVDNVDDDEVGLVVDDELCDVVEVDVKVVRCVVEVCVEVEVVVRAVVVVDVCLVVDVDVDGVVCVVVVVVVVTWGLVVAVVCTAGRVVELVELEVVDGRVDEDDDVVKVVAGGCVNKEVVDVKRPRVVKSISGSIQLYGRATKPLIKPTVNIIESPPATPAIKIGLDNAKELAVFITDIIFYIINENSFNKAIFICKIYILILLINCYKKKKLNKTICYVISFLYIFLYI